MRHHHIILQTFIYSLSIHTQHDICSKQAKLWRQQEADTMFQYTMWMIVHQTYLVLSAATCHNSELIFIPQPQVQKSCRRHTMFQYIMSKIVHQTYLMLSSATLLYKLCCCSFLIKICFFYFHNSIMNFKTYQYLLGGVCCIETPNNHLHTTFVRIN